MAAVTRHLFGEGVESEVHAPEGPAGPIEAFDRRVAVRRFQAYNPFLASAEARQDLWQTGGNILSIEEPLRLLGDPSLSLVHLHTMGRLGGGVRVAMRISGRPYVVSVHGPLAAEADYLARETSRKLERTLDLGKPVGWLTGSRRVLDDAARVIVFNQGERRALEPRLGSRVVCMDHGVDVARFAAGDARRARARWPELGGGPVALMVARLSRQKNQTFAVEAFARGAPPEARLVLAGAETDAGIAAEIVARAQAAGVADRVHWVGNVAPSDVPDLLAAADLVLVPSLHEAFGLAALEGWAAGRAVLFSDVAGLKDVADNLADRWPALPVGDAEAWAGALRAAFENPSRREAAASEGRRVVEGRYAWPSVARGLAAIYREVTETTREQVRP